MKIFFRRFSNFLSFPRVKRERINETKYRKIPTNWKVEWNKRKMRERERKEKTKKAVLTTKTIRGRKMQLKRCFIFQKLSNRMEIAIGTLLGYFHQYFFDFVVVSNHLSIHPLWKVYFICCCSSLHLSIRHFHWFISCCYGIWFWNLFFLFTIAGC